VLSAAPEQAWFRSVELETAQIGEQAQSLELHAAPHEGGLRQGSAHLVEFEFEFEIGVKAHGGGDASAGAEGAVNGRTMRQERSWLALVPDRGGSLR
jgi:hypothetical protein